MMDDIDEQFAIDFEQLARSDRKITLTLSPAEAFALLAQLQLALRHPANGGGSSEIARAIAQYLELQVATTPALRAITTQGWNEPH
jgi:hypothetical protein